MLITGMHCWPPASCAKAGRSTNSAGCRTRCCRCAPVLASRCGRARTCVTGRYCCAASRASATLSSSFGMRRTWRHSAPPWYCSCARTSPNWRRAFPAWTVSWSRGSHCRSSISISPWWLCRWSSERTSIRSPRACLIYHRSRIALRDGGNGCRARTRSRWGSYGREIQATCAIATDRFRSRCSRRWLRWRVSGSTRCRKDSRRRRSDRRRRLRRSSTSGPTCTTSPTPPQSSASSIWSFASTRP